MPGASEIMAELREERAAKRAAWVERVREVLFRFGMIDEILVEETADFLIHEDWLVKRRELSDTDVLLLLKAVAKQSTPWPTPLEREVMRSRTALTDYAIRRDSQLTREESLTAALARASVGHPRGRRRP
jgi:hypothetical protein